ncbi:MAG: GGDEF domain-containing protein [Deltaproteobacteria bacterium]|nr:GGDEF domain-containing protein [Deltaproteobacteria bacterium]
MTVDQLQDEAPPTTSADLDTGRLEERLRRTRGQRSLLVVLSGSAVGTLVPLDISELTFGRDPGCDVRLGDDGVSRRHARLVAQPDGAWQLEDLGSTNGTTVNGELIERRMLQEGDRILFGHTVLKFVRQAEVDTEHQARVYEMSVRDPLTRLYNRRYFEDRLQAEVAYARRHRSLVALLLIEVDGLPELVESRGRSLGDRMLVELALRTRAQVRSEDVLARFADEMFAVLLREIPPPGVMVLAERIRTSVERLRVDATGGELAVTVSIGAATFRGGSALTEDGLIDAADRLLYRARTEGRNRTCAEATG